MKLITGTKNGLAMILLVFVVCSIVGCQADMERKAVEDGLESHDRALHIKKDIWIRDPYIYLAPDDYYYLTGTTQLNRGTDKLDRYNSGLGKASVVGYEMSLWRSRNLVDWEDLGTPYSLKDGIWYETQREKFDKLDIRQWRLWAPELHLFGDRWVIIHTSPAPVKGANLSMTKGFEIKGPYDNPMGTEIGRRHDPSLFKDDDGAVYMVWGASNVAKIKDDFSGFAMANIPVGPSNRKIGHEGSLIHKIGGKYVLFGTGWSTDKGRKGTYNLYYCVADKVTGPYGPRKFAGRFLGHGTPFKDKDGRWWCTAFYNANVPTLSRQEARGKDLGDNAYTINPQGVNIIPLEVKVLDDGEIYIRAKDPDYANPGPEEVQKFCFQ